ncbi:NAD(P)-dependent oxidoreductase [Actinorugispora endophytica]|uniref:3-hydroxyisobutyrate dehydrogenase n=1 Tax=Actinorugispora endophytica TaxID=1605990 RepID=A0A4R6V237_9ACTN|nr:NAD(P)-dependent oxidoreductase [Actinorugispora endophytica]TDQ54214.1 3-hydroxyisobutyrate dehydrogenase [Actinorugispora endophytica]
MSTIAFLGVGAMGAPMARRLLAAGHPVTVWNRTRARAEPLAGGGARVARDPADAVRGADIVITMLAGPAAVLAVADAALPGLGGGARLVEMSTVGPGTVAELAARLPEGTTLVDAPVMGSVDRAATGTLSILAGGDVAPVEPVLAELGTVTRCGPAGSGAALKVVLINAVIGGVALVGEALALGDALGLPEELTRDALARGPLAGPLRRALDTDAHYPLGLAAKDTALARAAADLPLARAAHGLLLGASGIADQDLGRLVPHIRTERQETL